MQCINCNSDKAKIEKTPIYKLDGYQNIDCMNILIVCPDCKWGGNCLLTKERFK